MNRRFVAVALGSVLALGLVAPVAAKPTMIPISGDDTGAVVLEEGRTWVSGPLTHVRGWSAEYTTTGGELVNGTSIIVANWNIDATGDGTMWGTTELTLTSGTGGWHETWVAKFEGGSWAGWGVGRGWGDLDGMRIRLDVFATGPFSDHFEGYVF